MSHLGEMKSLLVIRNLLKLILNKMTICMYTYIHICEQIHIFPLINLYSCAFLEKKGIECILMF